MPNLPRSASSDASSDAKDSIGAKGSAESARVTGPSSSVSAPGTPKPWLTIVALVVALIAVALAVVGWFRPTSSDSRSFNDQQTADAKAHTCEAFRTVRQAVVTNTHLANPEPGNRIGAFAVAANARLALLGGGEYLRDRVAREPATPADLADAVNSMANTIEELGIGYLAGLDSTLQPMRDNLNSEIDQLKGLCQ